MEMYDSSGVANQTNGVHNRFGEVTPRGRVKLDTDPIVFELAACSERTCSEQFYSPRESESEGLVGTPVGKRRSYTGPSENWHERPTDPEQHESIKPRANNNCDELYKRRSRPLPTLQRGIYSTSAVSRLLGSSRKLSAASDGTPSSVGQLSRWPSMQGSPDHACHFRPNSVSPCGHDSYGSSKGSRRSLAGTFGDLRLPLTSLCGRASPFAGSDSPVSSLLCSRRLSMSSLDLHSPDFRIFRAAIMSNRLCAAMAEREVLELTQHAELFRFYAGDELINPADWGRYFFVIRSGRCTATFPGKDNETFGLENQVYWMGPGDSFGEDAVVHGVAPRYIVHAAKRCKEAPTGQEAQSPTDDAVAATCWVVKRRAFVRVLGCMVRRVYVENLQVISSARCFQYLDSRQRAEICEQGVVQIFDVNKVVTYEGSSHTDCLFIVKSGVLSVTVRGEEKTKLYPGEEFGERAWLYNECRSATVTSLIQSSVIVFPRPLLLQIIGPSFDDICWRNVISVAMRDFLAQKSDCPLRSADPRNITDAFMLRTYPPKSEIVRGARDALGLRFVVILNGEVLVKGPSNGSGFCLKRGEFFGAEYLRDVATPFHHTIENVSEEPVHLAMLSADAVAALTALGAGQSWTQRQKMELIRKVYVFRHISNHHAQLIARSFRTIRRKKGDVVIKENEIGSQFFVIKSGELVVAIRGVTIRTLGKGDYFGERGLLYAEPRTATVTIQSADAELLVMDKVVFSHIVQGKMLQHLEERICLQQTDVTLSQLMVIGNIGRGTFGVVKLVEHVTRKTRYALKCISIAHAVEKGQHENLRLEREILLENDHPFIVNVVRTFKDANNLYFLTELIEGGELFKTMRSIGILTVKQTQFYVGGLVLALESLHERGIAYRDLKPENVLLDKDGFTKLIDFGCAKKISGPTHTVVGTPHYMAPEVICGHYGLSCDYWSLGVCVYELLCGPLPFGNDTQDTLDVFREILQAKLTFPPLMRQDRTVVNLLQALLRRPLENRLGCGRAGGWRAVRGHVFFHDFNFDKLLSRDVDPPFVPSNTKVEVLNSVPADVQFLQSGIHESLVAHGGTGECFRDNVPTNDRECAETIDPADDQPLESEGDRLSESSEDEPSSSASHLSSAFSDVSPGMGSWKANKVPWFQDF